MFYFSSILYLIMLDTTFKTLLLALRTYNLCAETEHHVVWEYINYTMYKEEASY